MPEGDKTPKSMRAEERRRRLAAELRANLAKRKAQARTRAGSAQAAPRRGGERSGGA
jgi:hypothetical protein